MPKNIITTPEQKFSDELKKELKGAKSAKFAVGWFFISGLKELKGGIDELESLQILISPSTNRHTAETMLMAERFRDEAVADILETQYYQTPEQKKEILENEALTFLEKAGKLKPSKENAEFIAWFAQKLAEKKITIRIYTKEILHAKVYLINKDANKSVVFTGSSNISISGFATNTEVNVRLSDEKQVKRLEKWFDEKWQLSNDCDFTALAGKALEESWALNKEVTPFRIYLRILHDIFSLDDDREKEKIEFNEDVPKLFLYQKHAVIDAYHRLQNIGVSFWLMSPD
ncbi:MAG: phospholipase D-like domain-containing protein [Patescibacteria group bacterium]